METKNKVICSWILAFMAGMIITNSYTLFFPETARTLENVSSATIKLAAIKSEDGEGTTAYLSVEIVDGMGRVLINVNPRMQLDTQESAEIAVEVAEKITGVSLENKDVIFSVIANSPVVGGPSAGAAMAIATIAAIESKTISPDVMITGEIDSDGDMYPVGGLTQKVGAAADIGIKTFLVPVGERLQTSYITKTKVYEPIPGFKVTVGESSREYVDLIEYAKENYGMSVIEIKGIESALGYMVD